MHVLVKIVIPPQEVSGEDQIDIDELSEDELEEMADRAFSWARTYVEDYISIHSEGSGGFADWHKNGAGRWTDSLLKDYTNVYSDLARDEEEIVLVGNDAKAQLEIGWENTKNNLEERQRQIRADLEEGGLDATDLLEMDPTKLREVGEFGMIRHNLQALAEYAPQPEVRCYVGAPMYQPIETETEFEQALEDIENGGFVVPIDVHY